MPAPANAPRNGTLVGATPALLELLAALEAADAAEDRDEAPDLAALPAALAPPVLAALLVALPAAPATEVTAAEALEALEAAVPAADMLWEVEDCATAMPAKRRANAAKRMLMIVLLLGVRSAAGCGSSMETLTFGRSFWSKNELKEMLRCELERKGTVVNVRY
jgi:hypothetical protein